MEVLDDFTVIKTEPMDEEEEKEVTAGRPLSQGPEDAILKQILLQGNGNSQNAATKTASSKILVKLEPENEEGYKTSDQYLLQAPTFDNLKKALIRKVGKTKNVQVLVLRRVSINKKIVKDGRQEDKILTSFKAPNGSISLKISSGPNKAFKPHNAQTKSDSFQKDDLQPETTQEIKRESKEITSTDITKNNSCDSKNKDTPKAVVLTGTNEVKYKCPLCEFTSKHRTSVFRHLSCIHSDVKKLSCELCSYGTNYKAQLKLHIAYRHTNDRKYECSLCEYKAVESRNLKRHMVSVHSAEGRKQCPMCDLSTIDNNYLARHIRVVHLKEKTFKCSECNYAAGFPNHLKYHVLSVHRKEKPHACNQCDYRCSQPWDLKKHILARHAKQKPFKCPYCVNSFITCYALRSHLKNIHTNK